MHKNTFTLGGKRRFTDVPWSERGDAAAAAAVRLVRAFLERHDYKGAVLWSTMSPAHFKGGDWNTGGRCVSLRFPYRGEQQLSSQSPGQTLSNCLLGQWEVRELRMGFEHFGGRQDSGVTVWNCVFA